MPKKRKRFIIGEESTFFATAGGGEGDKCKYPTRLDTYGCGCAHDCKYCYAKSLLSFRGFWKPYNPKVANIEDMEKIIAKYESLGIDPATKQIVYSNALNIDRALELHAYTAARMQDSYGIGTHLTCDIRDVKPMNIVIKLTRMRITELREWHDCVKLSCDKGKTLGNPDKCRFLLSQIGE